MSQTENGKRSGASEAARIDVKSEVALTLIAAMEKGETPWQKPWAAQSLRPVNATTGNAYRGVNRLLLALSGKLDPEGRADPRFATYQQAQANGWQVRRGEKGIPIVKVVEVARGGGDALEAGGSGGGAAPVAGSGGAASVGSGSAEQGKSARCSPCVDMSSSMRSKWTASPSLRRRPRSHLIRWRARRR